MGFKDRFKRAAVSAPSAADPHDRFGLTVADALAIAREPGPTVGDAVKTAVKEVWGRAALCPECNGPGYLDRIDLVRRVQYEHCPDCFHRWSVAEADAEQLT